MARSVIFVVIFAFASVLVSSTCIKDNLTKEQKIVITNFTRVSPNDVEYSHYALDFIGDLEIGKRRVGDSVIRTGDYVVENPSDKVETFYFEYSVPGFAHYLKVTSERNPKAAVCSFEDILGKTKVGFAVRTMPKSRTALTMLIAFEE